MTYSAGSHAFKGASDDWWNYRSHNTATDCKVPATLIGDEHMIGQIRGCTDSSPYPAQPQIQRTIQALPARIDGTFACDWIDRLHDWHEKQSTTPFPSSPLPKVSMSIDGTSNTVTPGTAHCSAFRCCFYCSQELSILQLLQIYSFTNSCFLCEDWICCCLSASLFRNCRRACTLTCMMSSYFGFASARES